MRIHAQEPIARFVTATLNGEDVGARCVRAETAFEGLPGRVWLLARDVFGRFRLDESGRDFLQEIAYGDVRITLKEDAPAWAKKMYEAYAEYDEWLSVKAVTA